MGLWDRLSRTIGELSEELLPADLRDKVEGARTLLERGQAASAASVLEEVLHDKPDHATALYLLGLARLRNGDPTRAIEAFSRATEVRAGFGEALTGLGLARLAEGDVQGALAAYREALEHAGGDRQLLAAAYRGLGLAHLRAGALDKAVRELRKALVEDPSDGDAAAALGEALLADPHADPDEARGPLERAAKAEEPPAAALVALGRLDVRAGRLEEAEDVLRRAMRLPLSRTLRLETLLALADCSLSRGDLVEANDRLLRALELAPERPDLHARLGDFHRRAQNLEAALASYQRALELDPFGRSKKAAEVAARALDTAMEANDLSRAGTFASEVLAVDPGHVRALAARGATLVAAGEGRAAREILGRSLGAGDSVYGHVALGRLDLGEGQPSAAVQHARAALRLAPTDRSALELLGEAGRADLGAVTPAGDLYALATRVHAAALTAPLLADLAPEALRTVESYDRPLLVTVMGEFSSGKSTFVNAFLGTEVAPVGVTPTTATINILKYGRRKAGRIVFQDDTVRELGWEEVSRALRALDPAEIRRVRHVEVLYPSEVLERVNIVDTPGLNSILPEHEQTARRFIAQADAMIWLFTALQAGKASEREALERIRGEGKRVLGVVNKIDQAGEGEVPTILEHLGAELGGLVEVFIPVSARQALAARQAGDATGLAAASWPALEEALEERFFRQARRLKREACAKRIGTFLGEARGRARAAAERAAETTGALRQAAVRAHADAALFLKGIVPEERRRLAERVSHTYRSAAREVLELVRPRKLPFGTHSATPADRDYLVGHLDRGLTSIIDATRTRVHDELRRAGAESRTVAEGVGAGDEIDRQTDAAVSLVDAAVFQAFRSYLRGYVRGGRVDEFFARTLPRLALEEDAVYHALVRDAPDLENELFEPLAREGEAALRRLAARLGALADVAELARHEAEAVLLAALDAFATERDTLAAEASS